MTRAQVPRPGPARRGDPRRCTSSTAGSPTRSQPRRRARAEGWIVPGPGRRALPPRARRRRRLDEETTEQQAVDRPGRGRAADPRLRLGGRHRLDPRARRPAAADPGGPAHRAAPSATSATTPTRSSPTSSRRTSRRRRSAATAGSSWSATGSAARRGTWRRRSRPRRSPRRSGSRTTHGAKVTAHCFGEAVLPGLIEAGIDCIEHGTGLSDGPGRRRWSRTARHWCRR